MICQSLTATARAFKTSATNLHFACTGKTISCCGMYFRNLSDEINVAEEDLGTLTLEEYDQLCGVVRIYYPTKHFSRKGCKYNKNNKKHKNDENKTAI